MRILVATDQWSPDVIGGAARVAADTARGLAGRGHEVVVLAPESGGLAEHECDGRLEVRRCIRRSGLPQTFGDVLEARRLVRQHARGVDVILAHQNTLAAGIASARLEVPLALVFHASIPLEQRFLRSRVSRRARLRMLGLAPAIAAVERRAVARADGIVVLSDYTRRIVAELYPKAVERVMRVSGGVDGSWFRRRASRDELRHRLGLPSSEPLIVSVRRLEPRMGLEELLQAAALLATDDVPFTLAIAGDGILSGRLEELVRELGLTARVLLLGRIPEESLRDLYATADLSVVPTVAYEGFGMSTVESLASGTPVLGTAVGATPELLEPLDPRLVIPTAEPAALATGLRETLGRIDDEFRVRCEAYARKQYGWQHAILEWEAALTRVAGVGEHHQA